MADPVAAHVRRCREAVAYSPEDLGERVYGDGFPAGCGVTSEYQVIEEIKHIEANDDWTFHGTALRTFWRRVFACLTQDGAPADMVRALQYSVARRMLSGPFTGFMGRDPRNDPDP